MNMNAVIASPWNHPYFPSAKATVCADRFEEALMAMTGVPQVFTDGQSIWVPEPQQAAIEHLRAGFDAKLEFGCFQEYEFATRARDAGVHERLIQLGQAVVDVSGQTISHMIRTAVNEPDACSRAWSELYQASMLPE